jgi:hypothetical protein
MVVSNTRRLTALDTFSAASRCGTPLPCPPTQETSVTQEDVAKGPSVTAIAVLACLGVGLITGAVARILS